MELTALLYGSATKQRSKGPRMNGSISMHPGAPQSNGTGTARARDPIRLHGHPPHQPNGSEEIKATSARPRPSPVGTRVEGSSPPINPQRGNNRARKGPGIPAISHFISPFPRRLRFPHPPLPNPVAFSARSARRPLPLPADGGRAQSPPRPGAPAVRDLLTGH